jgi:dihydrolipoyl dehydrogenase
MPEHAPETFDLIVIGCGPGGFAGAMRAADLGRRVCIVEADEIGGAGVMWGALASKTMWELAKDYDIAKKVDRGYRASDLSVHYPSLRATVIAAVEEKQQQMLSQLETFSPRRRQAPGSITLKPGRAAFVDRHTAEITYPDGRRETVRTEYFLIATGSSPRSFPGIKTDQHQIIDSNGVLNLTDFPARLMIIGAGIIGCEYATIFSNFGQTRVHLVDHADRVIPYEDEDVSDFVSASLAKNGVKIYHSAVLKDIQHHDDHLDVVLDFTDGRSGVVKVDAVLVSIGRVPNTDGLNLDAVGIEPNDRGFLETDGNGCVSGNIYASGDVTQHPALVNLAEMESRYAAKHIFGSPQWPMTYRNMSTVMFFKPTVAAVGLNEKSCQKKKIPYRVGYYANALLSRAIAMRSTNGFVKIIVSDDADQKILGMRAAGPQVSTTIMSVALLMDQDKGIRDVLKSVHPHPTMSEGIQDCLRLMLGKSIFKPEAFPNLIRIRAWHPDKGFHDGNRG